MVQLNFHFTFLFWSYFAVLDEASIGMEKVISSEKVQTIQNREGEIVKQILIKEGEMVKKNQALVILDSTQFRNEYEAAPKKHKN